MKTYLKLHKNWEFRKNFLAKLILHRIKIKYCICKRNIPHPQNNPKQKEYPGWRSEWLPRGFFTHLEEAVEEDVRKS